MARIGCLVLWDFENIPVPSAMRGEEAVRRLKHLVLNPNHGIPSSKRHHHHSTSSPSAYAPLDARQQEEPRRFLREIIAVGHTNLIPAVLRTQLQGSGVTIQDCASKKASAADMAIMNQILKFTFFQKPPFRIYLISSDSDFAQMMHLLDGFGYNVTLIHNQNCPDILQTAARESYEWADLMGTKTSGKGMSQGVGGGGGGQRMSMGGQIPISQHQQQQVQQQQQQQNVMQNFSHTPLYQQQQQQQQNVMQPLPHPPLMTPDFVRPFPPGGPPQAPNFGRPSRTGSPHFHQQQQIIQQQELQHLQQQTDLQRQQQEKMRLEMISNTLGRTAAAISATNQVVEVLIDEEEYKPRHSTAQVSKLPKKKSASNVVIKEKQRTNTSNHGVAMKERRSNASLKMGSSHAGFVNKKHLADTTTTTTEVIVIDDDDDVVQVEDDKMDTEPAHLQQEQKLFGSNPSGPQEGSPARYHKPTPTARTRSSSNITTTTTTNNNNKNGAQVSKATLTSAKPSKAISTPIPMLSTRFNNLIEAIDALYDASHSSLSGSRAGGAQLSQLKMLLEGEEDAGDDFEGWVADAEREGWVKRMAGGLVKVLRRE
ncbi:hypothetical protein HDV05_005881 [Chytridiales sp. JEL 0842]|nr:hypothetical protein HDV05_005881 [Chytridiales sp. JEL 0842]